MRQSRRDFFKFGALSLVAIPFLSWLVDLGGSEAIASDVLPFAKETEEPAKSLKYCSNAEKPGKNCVARKAKEKSTQFCYNCQLFNKTEGEKKTATGKCLIMPKNQVPGNAWCQSWVQNPNVSA